MNELQRKKDTCPSTGYRRKSQRLCVEGHAGYRGKSRRLRVEGHAHKRVTEESLKGYSLKDTPVNE